MFQRPVLFLLACISASAAAPVRPLLFEPTEATGGFLARGTDHSLRFTSTGIDFSGEGSPTVHLSFSGARAVAPVAQGSSVSESHYYVGKDSSKWRTGVPNYERIRYTGIYPGIDLIAYGAEGFFEYDLEVAPHADPSTIRMRVQGTPEVSVNADGDLELGKAGFRLRRPRVTQQGREIAAEFRIGADGLARFSLGEYDSAKPLTIDPIITFSTFHGGTWGESTDDVTVDKDGNVYVTGYTGSDVWPGTVLFGQYPSTHQWGFVSKFAPMVNGRSQLLYTIFLGSNAGSVFTTAQGVAVDGLGNVIVVGTTNAPQFPIVNAAQSQFSAGACTTREGGSSLDCPDAFVTKFAPDGRTILFSTFFGGRDFNEFNSVVTDAAGDIYAIGDTSLTTLQGTATALQQRYVGGVQDTQLVRFSSSGQLLYSTFLGGSALDSLGAITVEAAGVVWVAGFTDSTDMPTTPNAYQPAFTSFRRSAFVARIDTRLAGNAGLTYATFFGRAGNNSRASGIFRDSSGQVVFCGTALVGGIPATTPTAFQAQPLGRPTPSPAAPELTSGDGYIARLNPVLSATAQLTYASYVGGTGLEENVRCGEDATGNFIVTGETSSGVPFFTTGSPLPYKPVGNVTNHNVFLIRIDPRVAGGAHQSILFGGNGFEINLGFGMDSTKRFAYMAGRTGSGTFPVSQGATQRLYGGNTLTLNGQEVNSSIGGGDTWLTQVDVTATQPDPAKIVLLAGDYQFVNPGATLRINPSVRLVDATDKPVYAAGYPVDYFGTNVGAVAIRALTDSDGVAGHGVSVLREGPATLILQLLNTPPVTFNLRRITGTLPTSAVILSGSGQSGRAGTELSQPLVVEIRDATNGPLQRAGFPVQFKVDNVTVSSGVVETDAQGRASTRVTLGTRPGPMKITVVVGALPEQTATFSSTGPVISAAGVVNAATFVGGSVSPGLIVTVFGDRIGPSALALGAPAAGKFPVLVGETRVLFDGVPAPIVYVSSGQTSVIVPYAVAGKTSTVMTVEYQGVVSNAATIPVVAARPGLFSANSSGSGQGALLNEDNTVNSASNPLARRKIAVLFATGEGVTTPGGVDGQLATSVYPKPNLPVRVRIGGVDAEVLYAGAAPTLVAGVLQVNVRVPASTPDGNAVVELFVGDAQSPATVTMAVRGD